jgi:hypothetical protein
MTVTCPNCQQPVTGWADNNPGSAKELDALVEAGKPIGLHLLPCLCHFPDGFTVDTDPETGAVTAIRRKKERA